MFDIELDMDVLVINGKRYVISCEELHEQHGNDEGLYVLECDWKMTERFCKSCGIESEYPNHDGIGKECVYMECKCGCHDWKLYGSNRRRSMW